MRIGLSSLAASLAFALLGCAEPQQQQAPASPAPAATAAAVQSRGIVVAVTPEHAAVTIRHEAIPDYGMDAMTMEFAVEDASQLGGVGVGDQVEFELSGPIDIRRISVIEPAMNRP